MSTVAIALGMFAALLALLVALRAKTGNKIDIRNSDVVLALVPVALWLFLTGKIQEFGFGEVKIVAAIRLASTAPVGPEVSKLTIDAVREPVRMMSKGGPDVIPQMISTKSQGLSFTIGRGGYAGPAIADYLDQLTQYPFLRYVVLNNSDDTFFGIADARQIEEVVRAANPRFSVYNIADWINGADKTELAALPGFVSSEKALHKKDDKRKALETMNSEDAQVLPVLDEEGKFDGIVDRSKLTASILTEIAQRVEKSD
jgi:CBS domain-containing protein